ncbi:laccase [Exidia glandulosa HHB12029]|uniref:laccase n=1 Tax=Exidia glandulosa HHB12029 TaxID=1314781 RepID=A0A165KHT8_EXIGL|nr:laccase [Exidia glandulosa HHB12029]
MGFSRTFALLCLSAPALVSATSGLGARQTPGCTNDQSRLCWDGTFDINTNYYTSGPRTGKTVVYNFELTNVTLSPEGVPRQVLAINGQFPGPTIVADWGDTIQVNVKNSMTENATSIHWHGIRQFENSKNDGVNGVTECPLAPDDTKTYTFIAEQYGTTWYHSHYSVQYGDGAWGAIQINGPATAEYDIDLGPIALSTIYPQTAFQEAALAEQAGAFPPAIQNTLINGTNVNLGDATKGSAFTTTFTPNKKHRLRFINTSVDTFFVVSVDAHNMTVIQSDFVAIDPYTTSSISIGIGQRYDVIIDANQGSGTYWLRATPQGGFCGAMTTDGSTNNGIIAYSGSSGTPSSTGPIPPANTACSDETQLVPHLPITVDQTAFSTNQTDIPVSAPFTTNDAQGNSVTRWQLNGNTMNVTFDYPTLQQLSDGNTTFPAQLNPIFLNNANGTAYWIIENQSPIVHPIHLHGHDFNVVSSGSTAFDPTTATLKWDNPPRRDVAMLPGNGYLLIAFKVDNPGVWIMHCHIAWHVSQGLSLQLIERQDEIFDHITLDDEWEGTCDKFKTWYDPRGSLKKTDSGL